VICTGGNIRTLQKLCLLKNEDLQTLDQLKKVVEEVNALSIPERIEDLGLREDRADVLPFASEIYLKCIALAQSEKVLVPNIGLKDGITEMLFQRNC
jgi:exopolyphosphatase/guanosine-5'-triphosphate,3'-diphosphate pyrophosphatase